MSDATLQLYHRQGRRNALLVGVLGLAALAALLLDLVTGPAGLPLADTLRALAGGEVGRGTQVIVWEVRLPVACMALLVGAALA
ncbi:iron chelate uptake ABC transporter family permease subunit, partial [Paracoccus sp. PXZ]